MSRIHTARYRVDDVHRAHAKCDHENTKVARARCRRTRKRSGELHSPRPIPWRKRRVRSARPRLKYPPPLSGLAWDIYAHMWRNRAEQPFTWLWVRMAFPNESPDDVTEALRELLEQWKIREA
jgi:hypothetical protein